MFFSTVKDRIIAYGAGFLNKFMHIIQMLTYTAPLRYFSYSIVQMPIHTAPLRYWSIPCAIPSAILS